jgi:regulator of protease activity HflC (stomatin/prohibitin superfamily)
MRNVLLSLLLLTTAACGATVHPGEAALKYQALRKPAFKDKVLGPGYYPLWAWNKLIIYDTTSQNRDEEVHVLTADNLHVPVTVNVAYHPRKEELFALQLEIGPLYYDKLIGPAFITLVRDEFSRHLHIDLAREGSAIEQAVHEKLEMIANEHHIEIDQIAIRHIDFDNTVTAAISLKIATRQQAEQKAYEVDIAARNADIARTNATGQADAIRIQAQGDADAIRARGSAQAEVQEQIGKTLTQRYLQYKAFDQHQATFYFVPLGKDGLPIIVDTGK